MYLPKTTFRNLVYYKCVYMTISVPNGNIFNWYLTDKSYYEIIILYYDKYHVKFKIIDKLEF